MPFPAALAVAPGFASIVGGPVFDLVRVRATLSDFPGDKLVLDTVAGFTSGSSELRLALAIQLVRPSQDFYLRIAAMDVLGDTLFRSVDTVTLRQNESSQAAAALTYTGPDTVVASVSISPRDTSILIGVPLLMRTVALATDQSVLKSVRFGWRSSDSASVTVAPDGTVLALKPVQGVWIVATTANGRRDSTQLSAVVQATP